MDTKRRIQENKMTYLIHHGIKGQKWGVRNGPPYPVDWSDHKVEIKKGTKFQRLSVYDESVSKGHAYVTFLNKDNERYRGFFGARLKAIHGHDKPVYAIEMEAGEDLLSPSKKERVETFLDLYKNDKEIGKHLGDYHKGDWHEFTPLPKKFYEMKYSKLDEKELRSKGYETFVRSIGGDEYIRGEYFKALSKKGYSFVNDDLDSGRFGYAPSIIFDREASAKYNGQKEISYEEIKDTWRKNGTYLKKERK